MKALLSGNEAIARGAYEAGVQVITGYPGTPSSEIVKTAAQLYGDEVYVEWSTNEKAARELLDVFGLDEERRTVASNLPYGKQRKLEIARALATGPKLLLLDEPAAGMNPQETAELTETIRFVRDHFHMTILLIEHDMSLVSGLCDELTVLNFGTTLMQGKTAEVLHSPEVIKAYLGD